MKGGSMNFFKGFEKKYYRAYARCLNCGWSGEIKVEWSYEVNEWYCPYCKCNTLESLHDIIDGTIVESEYGQVKSEELLEEPK